MLLPIRSGPLDDLKDLNVKSDENAVSNITKRFIDEE